MKLEVSSAITPASAVAGDELARGAGAQHQQRRLAAEHALVRQHLRGGEAHLAVAGEARVGEVHAVDDLVLGMHGLQLVLRAGALRLRRAAACAGRRGGAASVSRPTLDAASMKAG